jgi:membrane-bound ClpP family serine protease
MLKKKFVAISGAISTFLGGIGSAIIAFGLCPCVLAPIFSFTGIFILIIGFLSKVSIPLLTIGIFLLIISFVLHKKRHTCAIHKKK